MCPRSSMPRVSTMLRYTCNRSSRSSPASRTSFREPTGSALWAIATKPHSNDWGYSQTVGKAVKWLQEERRKVLGDWAAFCVECGAVRRWFEDFEAEVPTTCPQCGGAFMHRCGACGEPFS